MVSSYGVESTNLGLVLTGCTSGSGVGDGVVLGQPLFFGGVMNDFILPNEIRVFTNRSLNASRSIVF